MWTVIGCKAREMMGKRKSCRLGRNLALGLFSAELA
jgi:hypothetical protein